MCDAYPARARTVWATIGQEAAEQFYGYRTYA
jgi:hypothetical protein